MTPPVNEMDIQAGQQLALSIAKALGLPDRLTFLQITFEPDSLPIVKAAFYAPATEAWEESVAEFHLVPKTTQEI